MSLYVPLPLISTRTKKYIAVYLLEKFILALWRHFLQNFGSNFQTFRNFPIIFPSNTKQQTNMTSMGNLRLDPWPCWQCDQWIHGYGHLNIHHCQRTGQDQGWGGWVEIRSRSKMLQDAFFFEDSIKDHNKYGVHFFLIGLYIWKDFFDDVLLIELGHAWTENESETATTVAFN